MDFVTKIFLIGILIVLGMIGLAYLVGFLSDELPGFMDFLGDSIKDGYIKTKVATSCKNNHHKWKGCKCVYCGKIRKSQHKYIRQSSYSMFPNPNASSKCVVCGKVCNHRNKNGMDLGNSNCKCKRCGCEVHQLVTDDEWWDDKRNLYKIKSHCIRCGRRF